MFCHMCCSSAVWGFSWAELGAELGTWQRMTEAQKGPDWWGHPYCPEE